MSRPWRQSGDILYDSVSPVQHVGLILVLRGEGLGLVLQQKISRGITMTTFICHLQTVGFFVIHYSTLECYEHPSFLPAFCLLSSTPLCLVCVRIWTVTAFWSLSSGVMAGNSVSRNSKRSESCWSSPRVSWISWRTRSRKRLNSIRKKWNARSVGLMVKCGR